MVDGKVTPRRSNQAPAQRAGKAEIAPVTPLPGVITPGAQNEAGRKRFPEGTVFEFTIPAPGKFISLNDRMHHMPKARLTKAWRQAARQAAETAGLPRNLARVHVAVAVIKSSNRSYDVHNLTPTAKAAIDGLIVDYGLCADDSNDYLTGPDMRPGGRGEPSLRVVVTVLAASCAA
jgi:hypothetical protein